MVKIKTQYLAVSVAHKFRFTTDCLCDRGSRSKELDAAGALRRKSVLCKSFGFPADNFRTKIEMLLLLLQKGEKIWLANVFLVALRFRSKAKKQEIFT